MLTCCKKLIKSEFRQEKRQQCQLKSLSPKVGNIWMLKKLNATDLVYKQKILNFQTVLFSFGKNYLSGTVRARELKFSENFHPPPHVICQVSGVWCR